MKILILGCGKILGKHLHAISCLKNKFKIVGFVDKDIRNFKIPDLYKELKIYKNFKRAVLETNPDIVSILLPSGLHAKYILESLRLKKIVIVEKPMCLTTKDANKILRMSDKVKKKVYVVMQNKFNIPVSKLLKDIKKKKFGKIFHSSVTVRWKRDRKYYNQSRWRGTWKYDGGVVSNQASHHLDLLRTIMGDPVSVYAKNFNHLSKIQAEDTSLIIFKFKNNKSAIMEATTAARPKNLEGSLSVLGNLGSAKIGGFALNKFEYYNLDNTKQTDLSKYTQNDLRLGHLMFYKHIFKKIKMHENSDFEAKNSAKTVRLINAIYRSSELEKEVYLHKNISSKRLGK